jgi:thiol-disulfide isomerase/thioredoxin
MKRILTLTALALLSVVLIVGCTPADEPEGKTDNQETASNETQQKDGMGNVGDDLAAGDGNGNVASLEVGEITTASAGPYEFAASYDEAVAQAKAENKTLLLKFTADWCGPCHVMTDHGFGNADVQALLTDFVAVEVDIEDKEGNKEILEKYFAHTRGAIPYLLAVDNNGEELDSHTGYFADAAGLGDLMSFLKSI